MQTNIVVDVNLTQLRRTADRIDTYITAQDRHMNSANDGVTTMLGNGWSGQDATAFGEEWAGAMANDSTSVRFREFLRNFANGLRESANLYQRAQEDIRNQARGLMSFVGRG